MRLIVYDFEVTKYDWLVVERCTIFGGSFNKTTVSSKPLHFNRIHLTKNEWNQASSVHDRYYVYRLLLSKTERKLFLLQDPVGLYKKDMIDMIPSDGADITFDPKKVGEYEELLTWKS